MKNDPIGGALVILFVAIAAFAVTEMLSAPSKPVLEASGAQERATNYTVDIAYGRKPLPLKPIGLRSPAFEARVKGDSVLRRCFVDDQTNITFSFTHQPTCPEFTNGVWVIRFQP